jgi:hypothetical protein
MKAVSLSAEVDELQGVVLAARLLVDLLRYEQWGDERDVRRIPRAVSAILTLLECRMHQMGRVLRRAAGPDTLLADHNQALNADDGLVLAVDEPRGRGRARRG